MADPMPVDNVDDEYARASEAIRKLRRAKPVSKSEARFNSVELCRLQQTLVEAARAVAVRRSTNGSGSPGAPGASISGDMKALVRVIAGEIAALQRRIAA